MSVKWKICPEIGGGRGSYVFWYCRPLVGAVGTATVLNNGRGPGGLPCTVL